MLTRVTGLEIDHWMAMDFTSFREMVDAVVHRGEVINRAGGGTMGAGSAGLTVVVNIGGSVVSEGDLVDAVHDGLLRKQGRTGALGFRAA